MDIHRLHQGDLIVQAFIFSKQIMPKTQRIKIFIDGSNFYYSCKNIGILTYPNFDFEEFVNSLVNQDMLVEKTYYVGAIRPQQDDKKSTKLMSKQMKFFSYLKSNGWIITKGYMLKTNNKYHEKGVDVKLALDLVLGAVDDTYDKAILISSDTDLIPAIEQVQLRGKKVEYIGFENKPSNAILRRSKLNKLLTKSYLNKFVVRK
jgi:uncharacterized LabA/DUF88 family protein